MKNRFEIRGDVTVILLNRRDGSVLETLVDTADLPVAQSFSGAWYAHWDQCPQSFYVYIHTRVSGRRAHVKPHRALTNAPKGGLVDHINHDTLDNRQQNLRIVTCSQNAQNRKGANRGSTSGMRGVHWHNAAKKWCASITSNGRSKHVGLFTSLAEAERAVEQARERAGYLSDEPTKSSDQA